MNLTHVVLIVGLITAGSPDKGAPGPLTVHPNNPRYFTHGSGRAVLYLRAAKDRSR